MPRYQAAVIKLTIAPKDWGSLSNVSSPRLRALEYSPDYKLLPHLVKQKWGKECQSFARSENPVCFL